MKFLNFSSKLKTNSKIRTNRFARWRLINGVVFAVLIGVAIYFFVRSDIFIVRKLEVIASESSPFITKEKVYSFLTRYLSKSIFTINPEQIKSESLSSFLELESVEVKKDLPDQVTLTYEPRRAVLGILKDNEYYIVSDSGMIFAKLSGPNELGLPSLNAINKETVFYENIALGRSLDKKRIEDARKVVDFDWHKIGKTLNEINFAQAYYQLKLEDVEVLLSTDYTIEQQTDQIIQIYQDSQMRGKNIKLFDLRFERPVVRYF